MKRLLLLAIALCATVTVRIGGAPEPAATDDEIVHVLNRIGFGPRPGDVAAVKTIGLNKYIDLQLHPEPNEDDAMKARLAGLRSIGMSPREIAEVYELPQMEARRARKEQAAAGGDGPPELPDMVQQEVKKTNSVVVELAEQKVLRAIYSSRQLQEVLVDFWFNHFNVDARKGRDRFLLTAYDRDVIRPHVLGRFRDLLGATANSPAMLFYLDNWMSADPNGPHPETPPRRMGRGPFGGRALVARTPRLQPPGKKAPQGLNENYGRELMELHTLGVDGGYTQKDVTEVARAFTGWTIENPRRGGGFVFNPRIHDDGRKVVLGHVIKPGGGESDGEQVLDILAKAPATAHFIALKLARRFVSDTPPEPLVERAAARFRATDGDLRETVRAIVTSPEFLSPAVRQAKVKTPFEFVVSALRAVGADVVDSFAVVRQLQQLGMPLYQCQPPTGYKDTADAWVNTGALVNRMNFAVALTERRVKGVVVAAAEPDATILGGPEFQRR